MNAVCFIPARSGSKGVKDKNIRDLGGKPLLAWSIEFAKECGLTPVVSSDSLEYLKTAYHHGCNNNILRPKELAQDDTPMFDVLKEAQLKSDIIVLLQPTTPFRDKDSLLKAIEMMGDYDSVISVSPVTSPHPDEMMVEKYGGGMMMVGGEEVKDRITRRQDFGKAYVPTGSFYIFRSSNLDSGSIYGDRVGIVVEGDPKVAININEEKDFELAEKMLN